MWSLLPLPGAHLIRIVPVCLLQPFTTNVQLKINKSFKERDRQLLERARTAMAPEPRDEALWADIEKLNNNEYVPEDWTLEARLTTQAVHILNNEIL
jgi:hypothetical protein